MVGVGLSYVGIQMGVNGGIVGSCMLGYRGQVWVGCGV